MKLEWLRQSAYPDIDYSELLSLSERQSIIFFSAYEWPVFAETQVLSVGHRFHGNMLTTGTNRLGIVISHDERTGELPNGLQIPRLLAAEWVRLSNMTGVKISDCIGKIAGDVN
jgi:hypothetical protein